MLVTGDFKKKSFITKNHNVNVFIFQTIISSQLHVKKNKRLTQEYEYSSHKRHAVWISLYDIFIFNVFPCFDFTEIKYGNNTVDTLMKKI